MMISYLFKNVRLFAVAVAMVGASIGTARAELRIEVNQGVVEPIPIAISDFYSETSGDQVMIKNMVEVIENNLQGSGLFRPIDHKAFLQNPQAMLSQPRFEDWRIINAQALVTGQFHNEGAGKMRIEFRLWDIFSGQQMDGFAYNATSDSWRRVAHKISDAIYKRITGEDGYFDTRIVYVSESGPMIKRHKRLAIMDQDGFNHRFITDDKDLLLTPRFSPNMQKVVYMAYYNKRPRVYIIDLTTGKRDVVGDFPGMTFSPRFSPDGNSVILSFAQDGTADIYEFNLASRQLTRLTHDTSLNTSPCYSPDGKQIVFESDRGGAQQLYIMNRDGSDIRRLTYGVGRSAAPIWSPRGDYIAFTRFATGNKKFAIGVIRPDGTGERIIVEDRHAEGPTWAPNGRTLIYFKEKPIMVGNKSQRSAKLYRIDVTGYHETELSTPLDGSDPAWSPLLK